MTILVTGSSGHLGEALVRALRDRGTGVIGLDLAPSRYTDCLGSITDAGVVRRAISGASTVIHTATLHKPHLATHSAQRFVEVNVSGALTLLEAAAAAGVSVFVFASTTSAFGSALTPSADKPAAWIDEDVAPVARNIYGVSKLAAEGLCELFHRAQGLKVVILRIARFFPEPDDDPDVRDRHAPENVQANELLYRRADIADVVAACLAAAARAPEIGFGRYIVSATTPFAESDLAALRDNAPAVVWRRFPEAEALYRAHGWRMFGSLDRVYDNRRARSALAWRPAYDFPHVLRSLAAGEDFRSPLARAVGVKGYHGAHYRDGLYPAGAIPRQTAPGSR